MPHEVQQDECNRRHGRVWEAIGDMRKWRLSIYKTFAAGALAVVGIVFGFGVVWDNMGDAIAENAAAIKAKPDTAQVDMVKRQIKTTQENQVELKKGINSLATVVNQIAEKMDVETERPPHVVIRVDGDGE